MRSGKRAIFCMSLFFFVCWLPASLVSGAEEKASSPEKAVIAVLGMKKITLEELNQFIEGLPENVRAIAQFRKPEMLDSLINRRLIFRYAEEKKMGELKAVKDYVKRARREIMIRLMVQGIEERSKPTEKEMKAEYEKNKHKFQEGGKVTASHIMVVSEKEAKDLIAKLENGSKFDELAKKYSMAPERANGGSLGTITRGHHKATGLPEVIEQTAFSLKPGTHSGVVRSQFGWHVVYTSAKNDTRQMSFDEARPKLEKEMREAKNTKTIRSLLGKLKANYKVKKFPGRIK